MSITRDYGTLGGVGYTGASNDVQKYGQVYQATHYNEQRLPFMNRSFISFTFSDPDTPKDKLVHIEDFDLVVVFSDSRFEREGYTPFNDLTTTYDNLDGQYYWGTHYKTQTITFKLATDGIDQKMLDKFLHWFSAGVTRELILAEHPNRARLARVAEPPQLSLLPFESHTTMKISGYEYPVTTTLYKGDITLQLVMDDPHWYAKDNILGKRVEEVDSFGETRVRYKDLWDDITKTPMQEIRINESQDALKILYEDGIPLGSMIDNNMLLGNGAFANVEELVETKIWSIANDEDIQWTDGVPSGTGARVAGTITAEDLESNAYDAETNPTGIRSLVGIYKGQIAGAEVDADGDGIVELSPYNNDDNVGYFFYSGTAPAPTVLSFTFTPVIDTYVTTPANKFSNPSVPYSAIVIGSLTEQQLHFTTPNLLTSYNNAIKVFDTDCTAEETYENMRKHIREQVHHTAVRQWAVKIIDYLEHNETTIDSELTSTICTWMSYFLKHIPADENDTPDTYSIKCEFNSENGDAFGWFHYRKVTSDEPASDEDWATYGEESDLMKEDIGDMIRSNYLTVKERNYPTENGRIVKWQQDHPEYSHYIYHSFNVPLNNLSIIYKNMYL